MTFNQWDDIANFPVYQQRLKVALVHARTRSVKFWFFDSIAFAAKKRPVLLLGEIDPKLLAEVEKIAGHAKGRGRCSVNSNNEVMLQLNAGSVAEDKLNLLLRQASTNMTGVVSSQTPDDSSEPKPAASLAEITQRRAEILERFDALRTRAELDPAATKSIHAALTELGRLWARDPLSTAELLDTISGQLEPLEGSGLHPHHERKFEKMAIEKNQIIMVRCSNVESLEYKGRKGCCPKPVTCKAKTARFGPQAGLVVDPTHPEQNRGWKEALLQAGSRAEQLEIAASREAAIKEWAVFKKDQLDKPGSGYTVDSTTGVVYFHGDKIHGDVDLHGVFALPARAEGAPQRIDYGSGDTKGAEEGPASVRRGEMNSQLNPSGRQVQYPIQHGGEVDSAKHRNDPQPPIMAFTPQGREVLKDKAAVKKFYLERGLSWPPV